MSSTGKNKNLTERIRYLPSDAYPYDLEIFRVSDLKRRTSNEVMRRSFNYEFFMLIFITNGHSEQVIDFKSVQCKTGDLLIIRPGQAHNFGRDQEWDGWIVLFRPEFVMSASRSLHNLTLVVDLEQIPEQITLKDEDLQRVMTLINQMRADTLIDASMDNVQALLRYQILTLLTLFNVLHGRRQSKDGINSHALQRFIQFKTLVDECYSKWHQVAKYAERLGCTEKSLTRASLMTVGVTAKAFIAARINLEAKRLLAHSDLPITALAEKLGFDETTNFTKFFKREAGFTPSEFRRRQTE